MWLTIEACFILAGLAAWIWAIKMYLDDPGYGGFDMNTAPAFDFRWFRGTVPLAIGLGLATNSWVFGLGTLFGGTAVTFLVKPTLGAFDARRVRQATDSQSTRRDATGMRALSIAEQNARGGNEMRQQTDDNKEPDL